MVECSYCGREFSDEADYLDHLESTHTDELGPIDRRRVEQRAARSSTQRRLDSSPLQPVAARVGQGLQPVIDRLPQRLDLAIAAVVVFVLVMILWTIDFGFAANGVHDHGSLVVEINGDRVDFDQQQYHSPDRFHFHPGDGEVWHMHPDRLTFEEAMAELGIPVTETSITVDGTTYDEGDPDTSITMVINGESAALDRELHDGDQIAIVVETAG